MHCRKRIRSAVRQNKMGAQMTTKTFSALAVACILTSAGPAFAGDFSADCDGWRDTYWFGYAERDVFTTAVVTLHRLNPSTGLYEADETTTDSDVSLFPDQDYELAGAWGHALNGTFRATLALNFRVEFPNGTIWQQDYTNEAGPFTCSVPGGPPRTPGFWKTHPEAWPVSSLVIGTQTYTQACLMSILQTPTHGDPRIVLVHHLIAAKLNLLPNSNPELGGNDPSTVTGAPNANSTVADTIAAADQNLAPTTINCASGALSGSSPRAAARAYTISLKDALDAFNNGLFSSSSSGLEASNAGGCSTTRGAGLETLLLAVAAAFVLGRRRR